jgi:hypothetical protein
MGLFQPSNRTGFAPHPHASGERCPLCEQPIAQDVVRKIEARRQEQLETAMKQARAEAATLLEQKVAATRAEAATAIERKVAEAKLAAEQTLSARLAEFQGRLAQAEEAKAAAAQQVAALREQQQAAIDQRVQEIQEKLLREKEDVQREKEVAVLAEKAKVVKLQSELADLQRKLEGKSAHELGEGSEVDLFEQLRTAFEGDRIQRVPKGVNGADVIHEVIHNGKVCGKIIYDAKNRNAWQNEFASKLRADKLAEGADHAILSSNKLPKDRHQVHFQDGVIVANPARVLAIVEILRGQVVRMHELRASEQERGQKSVELYAFITSENFKQLLESVEAQAGKMAELDAKEQEAHRRIWDQRGKLIRSVQKARGDLAFEVDRIIGTAGNGPEDFALE